MCFGAVLLFGKSLPSPLPTLECKYQKYQYDYDGGEPDASDPIAEPEPASKNAFGQGGHTEEVDGAVVIDDLHGDEAESGDERGARCGARSG